MSIEFQNGFVCGMATKGLIKSGGQYEPIIYNDEGIYSHLYIDFKRAVQPISFGMLTDSIVAYTTAELSITRVDRLSSSLYKVYCDISSKPNGVTIMHKTPTVLYFADGKQVPSFSVHFFVLGQPRNENLKYIYEIANVPELAMLSSTESALVSVYANTPMPISETVTLLPIEALTGAETVSVMLGG